MLLRRLTSRRNRVRRALLLLVVLAGAGSATLALFGDTLLPPLVDGVRGVIGPEAMAGIESGYYGAVETSRQWQRDLGLAPPETAPWAEPTPVPAAAAGPDAAPPPGTTAPAAGPGGGPTVAAALPAGPVATARPGGAADLGDDGLLAGPPTGPGNAAPAPLAPIIRNRALAGEGVWTSTGLPAPPQGGPPAFWKTFLRPDPARPAALVSLVRFDPRRVHLHMVAGTQEPAAGRVPGPGQVAPADVPNLAVAFNGGWKAVNGHYGMLVNGKQIAPANPARDTATLAVHADGRIELGAWQTLRTATDVVSYRQNCPLLINNGVRVVQAHLPSSWGLSILSQMYVWRSGIGITADGDLIYAAGNPASADELAVALQAAGAVYAMQLDINSAWVHWLNYTRAGGSGLHAVPLVHGMAYQWAQYLSPGARDFFYLTWK